MIHSMNNSILTTLFSQRIGKLHYFPYLAFLSILFVSIIQFYTLSIRFYQLLTRNYTIDSTLTKQESQVWSTQYTYINDISRDSWFKNDQFLSKWKISGSDHSMLNEIKILLYSNTIIQWTTVHNLININNRYNQIHFIPFSTFSFIISYIISI